MSHERQFVQNIPFAQGETQHDQSITGLCQVGDSSTIENSTYPALNEPDQQGDSSQLNSGSLITVKALNGVLDDFRNKTLTKP